MAHCLFKIHQAKPVAASKRYLAALMGVSFKSWVPCCRGVFISRFFFVNHGFHSFVIEPSSLSYWIVRLGKSQGSDVSRACEACLGGSISWWAHLWFSLASFPPFFQGGKYLMLHMLHATSFEVHARTSCNNLSSVKYLHFFNCYGKNSYVVSLCMHNSYWST